MKCLLKGSLCRAKGFPFPVRACPFLAKACLFLGEGLPIPGEGLPVPGQGIPTPGPSPSPWIQLVPQGFTDPLPFVRPAPGTRPDEEERRRNPECGSRNLPLTRVTFPPGPRGQGGTVKASPLTMCPGNTRGSMLSGDIYREQFIVWRRQRGGTTPTSGYARTCFMAKLPPQDRSISGPFNLHGPGNQMWNLIITDKSLNGAMSREAERGIINLVYGNRAVLWYESKVDSYDPGLDYFAQSITVDAGVYNLVTGRDGVRFPSFPRSFRLVRTPPNCPASASTSASTRGGAPGAAAGGGLPATHTPVEQPATAEFAFHSTLDLCYLLESRRFPVSRGGVEVRIAADLVDRSGRHRDRADCPFSSYNVQLKLFLQRTTETRENRFVGRQGRHQRSSARAAHGSQMGTTPGRRLLSSDQPRCKRL